MKTIILALCLILLGSPAWATEVQFTWTPPATNCDGSGLTDLAGYVIRWGPVSGGPYTNNFTVNDPAAVSATVDFGVVPEGSVVYAVSVSFDANGNFSDDPEGCGASNEVAIPFPMVHPSPPTGMTGVIAP